MNRNLPMIPVTAHPIEDVYAAADDARVRALLTDDEYEIWLRRTQEREDADADE